MVIVSDECDGLPKLDVWNLSEMESNVSSEPKSKAPNCTSISAEERRFKILVLIHSRLHVNSLTYIQCYSECRASRRPTMEFSMAVEHVLACYYDW